MQSSAKDLASHTKLKFRKGSQIVSDKRSALQESLLKMEEAERQANLTARRVVKMGRDKLLLEEGDAMEEAGRLKLLKQTADVDEEKIRAKYDDEDEDGDDEDGGGRWSDLDDTNNATNNLQSDDSDLDASSDDYSDLDSDDEDEEAALQAELAKIRAERAAVKAREEAELAKEEQAEMEEAALTGNPLLNWGSTAAAESGRLKRRWNDDVVFRNQARGEPDQNKKRFINDTVRNDFHKRFMNKFIK